MDAREEFVPLSEASQLEVLASGSVFIKHPGVGQSLFCFPAYSYPKPADASDIPFGVLHLLALDACRVITNHAARDQADFLTEDREGKTRIPLDAIKLLPPGNYYYFLGPTTDAANSSYPIVKEFSTFKFPDRIPDHWYDTRPSARLRRGMGAASASDMSVHVVNRDQHCTMTKRAFCAFFHIVLMSSVLIRWTVMIVNRCAHLIPKAEAAWFTANEMNVYSIENQKAGVDTHTNGISLRDDVRRCLDACAFVFFPVHGSDKFMAYFVDDGYWPDYTEAFHRRLVTIHPSVAVEFIYARFAYNVIKLYRPDMFFTSVQDNPALKAAVAHLESPASIGEHGNTREYNALQWAFYLISHLTPEMNEASEHSQVLGGGEESEMGAYDYFYRALVY